MLSNIGYGEVLLLAAVGLLLFGAKRIPEAARGLGRALTAFKEGLRDVPRKADKADDDVSS
ncbi:MAG: hypothetical protein A3J74_03775 [Elusimicrobia bacterium RIFCSPHIGHO2_02_FULL_57_9]|nr:MAG: hypothetical protein A3J74_03775 [Elusimicrobia bacterium RIFCSPHIGHO2_02_FULL_57_9]